MPKKFIGVWTATSIDFGEGREKFLHHAKFNVGKRVVVQDLEVESKNARRFFEAAVIPMWIYLDGYDHTDSVKQKQYHEIAKEEFCPEVLIVGGKQKIKGGSTKGKLNGEHGITNKVIDYLEEQYGIDRTVVLVPEKYKDWKSRVFPFGGADNYIDHLVDMKLLKRV